MGNSIDWLIDKVLEITYYSVSVKIYQCENQMHPLLQLLPGPLMDCCSMCMNYRRTCNPCSPHTAANLAALPAQAQVHLSGNKSHPNTGEQE